MGPKWCKNGHFLLFLKFGSLDFSDFLHEVRGLQRLKNDLTGFLGIFLVWLKSGQKCANWSKKRHFHCFLGNSLFDFSKFLHEVREL